MLLNVIINLLVDDDDVDNIKEGPEMVVQKKAIITTMSIIIFMQSSLNSPTIEIFLLARKTLI